MKMGRLDLESSQHKTVVLSVNLNILSLDALSAGQIYFYRRVANK